MRFNAGWKAIVFAATATVWSASAIAVRAEGAKDLIREYTDDIETERRLLARGLGSEASLAMSYEYRGETYFLYLKDNNKAIADLSEAIKLFERAAKSPSASPSTKRLAEGRVPRSLLFRSLAKKKKRDFDEAEKDISRAITEFKVVVAKGEETLEPPLAWAYQIRAEVRRENGGSNEKSVQDIDQALTLLRKWGKRQKSLADKIPELEKLRTELDSK